MSDAVEFVKVIKRAAIDAVEASKPVHICFGNVISVNPLRISVEQKLILTEKQLILSQNVTEFKTKITIEGQTKKVVIVHNQLEVNDKVILLRRQKGQEYIVIDRMEAEQ